MTATNWDKFLLLMWKNWLLQWRHKFRTTVEVLTPVIFSALLVLIRSLVCYWKIFYMLARNPEVYPEPTTYAPVAIDSLTPLRQITFNGTSQPIYDWRIVYTPHNPAFEELVDGTSQFLGLEYGIGVNSSEELVRYLVNERLLVGLVFHHDDVTELPNQLEYSIRFPSELRTGRNDPSVLNWRTDLLFPRFDILGPRNRRAVDGGLPPGYVQEGFLTIQNVIADQYLRIKSNGVAMPNISVQRYPYPPYIRDVLLNGLEILVSLIILLSFVYPFTITVKFIATEKEKQLKESMKIMGLPNWLHWTSWFVRTMILMTISISLMVLLLKIAWYPNISTTVFTHSHWSCIWIFLFVFSMATTTFSFMLSVFFSKANTASAVSGLTWFLFYAAYSLTSGNYEQLAVSEKMLLSLLSNTAMAYGFQIIIRLEGTSEGLQWNNFWRPVSADDNISIGLIVIMLLVSTVLYLMVALYVEKIFPGDYGVPQPWYFPFTKSFWCGPSKSRNVDNSVKNKNLDNFEDDPVDRHCGIKAINLRKVYGRNKIAVEGLSLNMFDDQILIILGHNGAGKTTTMSMLTGMLVPTSGTAIINGKDIGKDINGVRNSLGLCPQHNILFDELTVREHIVFFSRLKGLDSDAVDNEVKKYVKLIDLEPKMYAMSGTLSGGMKRKLSVCIALCGGSKVVLLDEPTSGMDPASRRALWDILREERKGRTVLLSTHFMDEADILGDRIAIMSNGELKCVGSSYFLKKKFGSGYHLICVKKSTCVTEKITSLLQRYVPDIKVDSDVGTELSYQLPDENAKDFQDMFKELEDQSSDLGVDSYGISLTTMEEVFMRVGSGRENDVHNPVGMNDSGSLSDVQDSEYGSKARLNYAEEIPLHTGLLLLCNQVRALFKKKALYNMRSWILLLIQLAIPVLFISITVIAQRALAGYLDLPQLKIWLERYLQSVTVLETFETNDTSLVGRFASEYGNQISFDDNHRFERISEGFEAYILRLSEAFLVRVSSEYFVGATILSADRVIAWFNNQAYHTAPLSLSMVHNAVLRTQLGVDYQITVYNEPLPYSVESRIIFLQSGATMGFQMAVNIGFAMAFVASFYVLSYIKERMIRSKLLQFVSGANVLTFWLTAYIYDFFTFMITTLLLVITFGLFQEEGFSTPLELGRIYLVLVAFIFAILPITFVASKFFKDSSDGYSILSMIYIFTGIACFFIVFIMTTPEFDLEDVAKTLTWIFLIFPHFALSNALSNLNTVTVYNQICDTQCQTVPGCNKQLMCEILPMFNVTVPCCDNNYFDFDNYGIGRHLLYMFLIGVIVFTYLLLSEYGLIATFIYNIKSNFASFKPAKSDEPLDSDVVEEKEKVKVMSNVEIKSQNLVLNGISKFYGNFVAVDDLSIAVEQSECFGLLGVNGAGKTSAFKMLTGDETISSGEGWIRGLSLKNQMNKIHKLIGYCPQFDALIEDMTGRETLEMFCLLRGVPNQRIKSISMQLAEDLDFLRHLDKKVKEYSGGNKRKLSTAVSLIGNPAIVYFDEPTTGMDPGAKRQLWDMVSNIRKTGKSIILTSHSMDECEALCTRLAIMVNGEFKCLGSVQHLKNKFSQGFNLTIKVRKSNPQANGNYELEQHKTSPDLGQTITEIKEFVTTNFIGASLKEEYQGLITYFIPKSDLKWSTMFGLMEEAKSKFNIEDYSLSQTSLEQVFLSFAKLQREEKKNR